MSALQPPRWLTVFIDFPAVEFAAGVQFWLAATGYSLSASRGDHDEFATLVPPAGDAYLKVQRLGDGLTRLHLDVHVDDPQAFASQAVELGAEIVDGDQPSHVVLRSPAGSIFCAVHALDAAVPPSAVWSGSQHSRVNQICLDVPQDGYQAELVFWQALLGGRWKVRHGEPLATRMAENGALEFRLQPSMLAREPSGHLHLATDDRAAEVNRLVALGAVKRADRGSWTLLEAVGGMAICVVDDPDGGDCPHELRAR
jgi:hypothetical protein